MVNVFFFFFTAEGWPGGPVEVPFKLTMYVHLKHRKSHIHDKTAPSHSARRAPLTMPSITNLSQRRRRSTLSSRARPPAITRHTQEVWTLSFMCISPVLSSPRRCPGAAALHYALPPPHLVVNSVSNWDVRGKVAADARVPARRNDLWWLLVALARGGFREALHLPAHVNDCKMSKRVTGLKLTPHHTNSFLLISYDMPYSSPSSAAPSKLQTREYF